MSDIDLPILYQMTDAKGRPYVIECNIPQFQQELIPYWNPSEDTDDGDYGLGYTSYDVKATQEDRDKDREALKELTTALFQDESKAKLATLMANQPRKANGTFAKNRIQTLWRGDSWGHVWEDSYGVAGPEILLRAVSDYRLELVFDAYRVEKW